ncbi:MAG: nucleotidyl transferase AbiEii/AbiGii toxin family protein [Myxococcota bacterium]
MAAFLKDWGLPGALVGGAAIVARVRPRITEDLDLMLVVPENRRSELLAMAVRHGYSYDEKEATLLMEGGLVQLWGPPNKVDGIGLDILFVDSPFAQKVVERATEITAFGQRLSVASVEDLLLLKLEANRPEDIDDLLAIKDAFANSLDRKYLDEQALELGVADRLKVYFD